MKLGWYRWVMATLLWILVATPAAAQSSIAPAKAKSSSTPVHRWIGPDGQPLPWTSEEEVLEFLRKARIGRARSTGRGVTLPRKMELERDGVQANAIFHDIDEEKRMVQMRNETITNFRDSYLFQVAAYELSRMLGLQNVPPSVKRTVMGRSGSMTLWLEGMMTEEIRIKQSMEPLGRDAAYWTRQTNMMHVWDALIYNFDRNQGNILLDKDWNLWMIDHTRAFRRSDEIPGLDRLYTCERGFFERLRALDVKEVKRRLKNYLRGPEIDALMHRRDTIVQHFERLARERGEENVFFIYP